jgi:hypothetical protein
MTLAVQLSLSAWLSPSTQLNTLQKLASGDLTKHVPASGTGVPSLGIQRIGLLMINPQTMADLITPYVV